MRARDAERSEDPGGEAERGPCKLADAEQFCLFVTPAGGKRWRMNHTCGRNAKDKPAQKTLALGSCLGVPLLDARAARRGQCAPAINGSFISPAGVVRALA